MLIPTHARPRTDPQQEPSTEREASLTEVVTSSDGTMIELVTPRINMVFGMMTVHKSIALVQQADVALRIEEINW